MGDDGRPVRTPSMPRFAPDTPHEREAIRVGCVTILPAEYDNTHDGANHIHAVWRDSTNDFGDGYESTTRCILINTSLATRSYRSHIDFTNA